MATQSEKLDKMLAAVETLAQLMVRGQSGQVPIQTQAPAQGVMQQATQIMRRRTVQAVSWFSHRTNKQTQVQESRATLPGDLHVKGATVASGQYRTQLLSLNTGTGQFGQEVVYVPQTAMFEGVLEALRRDDTPIVLKIGAIELPLVRL